MNEQKNLILATGLSLAILFGYNYFIERPKLEKAREAAIEAQAAQAVIKPVPALTVTAPKERTEIVSEGARIQIETPSVKGSINLRGARFDDLSLVKYFTQLDHKDNVTLLSPVGTQQPYYIEQGWLADNVKTPNGESIWKSDAKTLTPNHPIFLSWDNGEGVTFVKIVSVDTNYLFHVTQEIENHSGKDITLYPYARIMRLHHEGDQPTKPADRASAMVMQGLLGVFGNDFHSAKYDQLSKHPDANEEIQSYSATGGWLGITDKYWFTALVPDQTKQMDARFVRTGSAPLVGIWPFRHVEQDERDFQADYREPAITVPAGNNRRDASHFFAGAKEMNVLDAYEKGSGVPDKDISMQDAYELRPAIPRFDLAVDFGWFYFITKPFFYLLSWIGHHVGNFGVAIILFTLLVRGAMFPVAAQSYRSMQKMKVAAPKMKELQAKYKDDPTKLQGEMMAFYRKEKVNPMAGCLPMLIQIPVFLSLYKVLYVTLEMRQAPFIGFITDLSASDPTNVFNLFGLLPFTPPAAMHLGLLPILMGITSFLQMRMTPTPSADPTQQQMFKIMPWMMMVLLASLPAGLLIYWIASSVLGVLQQWWIQKTIAKS